MSIKADFPIPVHPGEVLATMIDDLGLSQAELARHLHLDPSKINDIIRGRRGISAAMAIRLARAFKAYSSTPSFWLNLQKNWELSREDPALADDIEPIRLRA